MAAPAKPPGAKAKPAHSKLDHVHINVGLQVLYPTEPSSKSTLDIVALPGLGANPEFTWIRDKVHWLRDSNMLARKVPEARISVFQYQSQWFGKGAVDQRLENVADQLLYHLDRLRGENNKSPIIFVSHCLGGIVLERALITSRLRQNDFPSIFPSVAGCIFLGTPFKGTKTQSKAMVLAGMAETIGMGVPSSLLKLLEDGSEVLNRLLDEFVRLVNDAQIRVFCFFESEKSDLASIFLKGLPFKTQELIVDKDSATWHGVECLQLNSDHFKLNKYSGPKDGNFVSVSNEIKMTATKAAGIIKVRQKTVRQALINDRTYHALIDTLGRGFSDLMVTTKGSYTGPIGTKTSWIVEVDEYKRWREQDVSRLIWIHGKAGTGQGAIASSMIETLDDKTKEEGTIVASFFCDQSDENRRTLRSMLKLLIRQVIDVKQDLAVHLLTDSKSKKKAGKQDFDPEALNKTSYLWEALQNMAKDLVGGFINIVIYGLDQLSKESLEQFLDYMKETPDKGVTPDEDAEVLPIKWLLLSRSGRPEIEKVLKCKAHEINIDDSEHAEFVSDALRASISARVDEIGLSAPLGYFVKRHIHSRAEDNYIYVSLAIQELKNARASGMTKHSDIRTLLESMPFGLTDMFEHIRNRILRPGADRIQYTKEILRCLILARRAPTLRELAIMADLPEEDRDDLENLKGYLIRCGAFVELRGNEYDEDSMTVEWIDISAQEHLEKYAREALALEPELKEVQHGIIALRCLEYVYAVTDKYEAAEAARRAEEEAENNNDEAHDEHEDEQTPNEDHAENTEQTVNENDVDGTENNEDGGEHGDDGEHEEHHEEQDAPGTEVAHAEAELAPTEANDDQVQDGFGMEDALRYPVEYWLEHAKLAPLDVIEEFRTGHAFWKDDSPARQDWWSVADSLHVIPNQTNVSPLHVAVIAEFSGLVDHLLKHGWEDDIQKEDSYGSQPLYCACAVGNYEITMTLIGAGAEIDYRSTEDSITALYGAARSGHVEIVECLLDRDADINLNNKESGSALYVACEEDNTAVVQLLVQRKANVNIVGGYSLRPLNIAAWHGNEEVVRLLLDNGAEIDPEQPDYWYGSALGAACRRGHVEVVKLLISKGWSPTKTMKTYGSFLACAATYGHLEVVEVLLEKEARITVLEQALLAAAQGGRASVVQAILGHSPTPRHQKAFMRAADYGRDEVLRLLFPRGIEPQMLDEALYLSTDHEHESTVRLLLEFGASPNAEGQIYGCALSASAYDGTTEIMKMLIEKGADVNKTGGEYGNPLQAAAWSGNAENVKLLLDNGAIINTEPVGKYGHALQGTSDADTIRLLLEHGAEVNAYGGKYGYAIIGAVEEGDSDAVKIYLEYNADVNVRGFENNAPVIATAGLTLPLEDLEAILDRGADVNAADDLGTTALINCADAGDEEGLRFLLSRGANVHLLSEKFGTALHAAAKNGDEGCCRILLDAGSDVNTMGGPDGTPLQAAASVADLETIQMLLEAGANATGDGLICGTFGTPLQAACATGDLSVVRELVDHGAIINFNPANGKHGYPLHAAAASGNDDLVRYLLENGADVGLCGGEHGYALIAAAQVQWNYSVVPLLLEHGADASAQAGVLGNAAAAAAFADNSYILQQLIDAGANPHTTGGKYGSVLQAAAVKASDMDCVDILLNLSLNTNVTGGKYFTALIAAAYHGRLEVVEKLLNAGADFRIRGGKYMNAVAAAAMRGHTDVLEKFLKMGPPEQVLDEALVEACAHRQTTSVELLLKSGAHVYARHPTLGTAMDALKAEQADGYNSDDEQDDTAEEEDDADEDEDEDTDGEDDEFEGDDDSDGDGSVVDLQLEDEVSEEAKIQKLLDEAMARVKRNPSVKRFRTVKRGGLPASLKAGGPPQMPPRPSFQQYGSDANGFNGQPPQFQQQFSASPRQSFQAYPGSNQQSGGYLTQNYPPSTATPYFPSSGGDSQPALQQPLQGSYQTPTYHPTQRPQQLTSQFRPSPTGSPSRKPVPNTYQPDPSIAGSNPSTPPRPHSNGPSPVYPPQGPPRTESQEHASQRYSAHQPGRPPLNPGPGSMYQQQQSQHESYASPQSVPAYAQPSPQQSFTNQHPQGSYASPPQPIYGNPPSQNTYTSPPQSSYTQPPFNTPPQQYGGAPAYGSPPASQYQAFNTQHSTQPPNQGSGYSTYGQHSHTSSQTSFQSSQYANSSQYAGSQQGPGVYGTPNSSQASGFNNSGQGQNQGSARKWGTGGYDGEGYG